MNSKNLIDLVTYVRPILEQVFWVHFHHQKNREQTHRLIHNHLCYLQALQSLNNQIKILMKQKCQKTTNFLKYQVLYLAQHFFLNLNYINCIINLIIKTNLVYISKGEKNINELFAKIFTFYHNFFYKFLKY